LKTPGFQTFRFTPRQSLEEFSRLKINPNECAPDEVIRNRKSSPPPSRVSITPELDRFISVWQGKANLGGIESSRLVSIEIKESIFKSGKVMVGILSLTVCVKL